VNMFGRFRRTEEFIGFALSGGGARSACQVGALKALIEGGIWPQLIAGTSAGAVNTTYFALYPHRLDMLEAIWLGLRTRDIFPGSRVRMLTNVARRGYVHEPTMLERFLRRHVGNARLEDAVIPVAITAVRLSDGARVVFEKGEIVPAVMASTAIPGVYPPYRIEDELYVDGGVREHLPVPTLLERHATTIYALDCSYFAPSSGIGSVVDRCARIGASSEVERTTSLSATRGRTVHLLRPELPEIDDGRDFRRTAELVVCGYENARQYLDQGPGSAVSLEVPALSHNAG